MAEPRKQPARLVRTWVVAILALVGGGLYLCGAGIQVVGLLLGDFSRTAIEQMPDNPMRDAQIEMLDNVAFQLVAIVVGTMAGGLLIAGGIGLIRRQGWGRVAALAGGALLLVLVVLNVVGQLQMWNAMEGEMPEVPPGFLRTTMVLALLLGIGCGAGIPITCMALLMTPAVAAEIRAWDSWRRAEDAF